MKNNKAAALIFGQVLAIGILGIACVLLGVSRRDAINRSENLQAEIEASAEREEGLQQDLETKSAYIEELENRAPEIRTVEVEKVVEIEKVVEVSPCTRTMSGATSNKTPRIFSRMRVVISNRVCFSFMTERS